MTKKAKLKRIDRIRCRTIDKLLRQGIDHKLYLIPTRTLFDRPRLEVYGHCPYTKQQLDDLLNHRMYYVKVSGFGRAGTIITNTHIYFCR